MRFWFGNGAWAGKKARQIIQHIEPEQIRSIAVIRHAALGDLILTRPFLIELRKQFPQATITLSLVSNYRRGAPEDLVDRLHIIYGTDRREVSMRAQIRKARELGPQDLLFDLAATPRSFWLCALTRAQLKFGFPAHRLQQHLFYDVTVPRSDMRFEAEAMLDMLNAIGIKTAMPLEFALPGEPHRAARPYVVYFTSASAPHKCWPEERFATLIRQLAVQYPQRDHVVLAGVRPEESVAGLMQAIGPAANVSTCQIDSVDATISFIKGARLVVSNDTGIRHLAIAAGTPSLGLFFATDPFIATPFRYWPRFGRHEIALRIDGQWPSVDEVLPLVGKLLDEPA
ncbi:MAG: glycosyltransferase family 9 protein [Gammaproteobacteria bacterium]